MQYYLMPPIRQQPPQAGDMFWGELDNVAGYWILLTPSCDLVVRVEKGKEKVKAEYVLLAYCVPIVEFSEYTNKKNSLPKDFPENLDTLPDDLKRIKNLIVNNRNGGQPERYFYLPAALELPDTVVDFQRLITIPRGELDSFKRIASLDSPFAEALLARYTRFIGRLGTPDLNVEMIFRRLFPGE